MHLLATLASFCLVAASLVEAGHANPSRLDRRTTSVAQQWAPCGGRDFKGSTTCVKGWTCVKANDYYSQCVQDSGGKTTKAASTVASTVAASKAVTKTTSKATTETGGASASTKSPSAPAQTSSSPVSSSKGPIGFASLNGGTTGGAGGPSTTVSDLASLRNAVKGDSAAIVYISGVIKGDGETVKVGSNKSILSKNGGGKDGLTGGGLLAKEAKNVIVRGLSLSKSPAPTDLVGIQESTNVWVDHCTFTSSLDVDKDFYDGQLDITHAADFVTVSNNVFQQAWKTSLVGHSDNNGAEDKGHLRVTYHGNHFLNVNSRVPSLRFGTGHIFNNYYENVLGSGINARKGAQVLVESNYFKNVKNPIETTLKDGYAAINADNVYESSDAPDLKNVGSLSSSSLGYKYALERGASVPFSIVANAGATKYSA
ncbi:hypothetical protein JCM8208_003780 [Rhodotorula glutinis]